MLTQDKIKEAFRYQDGSLYRKYFINNNAMPGMRAGVINSNGYRIIGHEDIQYREHRLVWEMFNGEIPKGLFIDHIDRNRLNNRIENLRLVSRTQNLANRGMTKANTTGYKGVTVCGTKWKATIGVNGKVKYLGTFPTAEMAHECYKRAAFENFGEYAHFG